MSTIASFKIVSESALEGLKKAAVPRRTFFGGTKDEYDKYLNSNSNNVATYRWSGAVMATLLLYLEERHRIDLMKSEHDELAKFLTDARQATHFLFTNTHRRFLDRLKPENYLTDEMRDYFNEFNGTNETEIGAAMRDGISAIRSSLEKVDPKSVIIVCIG